MRFGPDQCQGCAKYHKVDETWVPYGDTMVKYSDDYECSDGWVLGDCPDEAFVPDEPHYVIRSHGLTEADWEYADWCHEKDIDEGRYP